MTSGQLVRQARRHLNLSQGELGELLAKAIGRPRLYSQAQISNIERGRVNKFSPRFAFVLAEILRKPSDYFKAWIHQGGAGAREEPQIHSVPTARKSETKSFGKSDMMTLIDLGNKFQLEFVAANSLHRTLVLTKRPLQFITAIERILTTTEEAAIDFTGENIQGRVCFFELYHYCFVVEFPAYNPKGYLIHLQREELVMFKSQFLDLPVSIHPTD